MQTDDIQVYLRRMEKIYSEKMGIRNPIISVRLFNDGSGRVFGDGRIGILFHFTDLDDFIDKVDQWILNQSPDETIPDVYAGMNNYTIEKVLAKNLYNLLVGLPVDRPMAIPFPEVEVDLGISSTMIHLAGRKALISVSVKDNDE